MKGNNVCEISSSHGGEYEGERAFWDIASCSPVVFNRGYRVPPGVREDILGGT
jgi:hypothetical protein